MSRQMSAPENGSIAEEIDDEEIDEDISIEADVKIYNHFLSFKHIPF